MEGIQDDKYSVPPLAESPWLITTHSHQRLNKLEKQTFRTNAKTYVRTIPELHRNIILGGHQGWLILRDRVNFTFYSVWNPVTSQLIRLPELVSPELEDDDDELILPSTCVFTSSPSNPEACVLVLYFNGGLMFSCRPTMSRNCNWVKQTLELYGERADIRGAAVIEGVIYANAYMLKADRHGRYNHIVRMDVVPQNCSGDSDYSITLEPMTLEFPYLKINFPDHRFRKYIVECCGVLYYMYIWIWVDVLDDDPKYMDIVKVMVWKLDFSKMEWIKIESLKNRALLVDTRSCTWCPAPAPSIDENCIYIFEKSRLYSYNLQDDSYTILYYPSFSPDPTFVQFYDPPVWFMPSTRQRLSLELDQHSRINEKTEVFQECVDDIHESSAGTLLVNLPTETLQLISRCMNLLDCMNLGATCKTLYGANLIAEWRANCSYPLFMVRKDNNGTYELLDPFENISHPVSAFDDSPTNLSTFECCQDGWLVLRSNKDYLRFLNPFTRKKIDDCPPCLIPCAGSGFSGCPTSSDFEIVGIFGYKKVHIARFEASESEWTWHEMEFNPDTDIPFYPNHRSSPRYHKNAFYFIGMYGCLGVYKFNQGKFTWHVYESPLSDDDASCIDSCYLVELDGELASVFIGDMGSWVRVFKFDTLDKCWLELDTLGDYVMFVSRASCFSVKSKKSEMKNRIYLSRRKDNEIVFYSLDTRMYHTASNTKCMYNFYGMKAQSSCCWVY